ncbi:hypothetical protein WG66_001132, partial [Moniliophthora roreri]
SEDRYNDEFVVAVVPEATRGFPGANYAAAGIELQSQGGTTRMGCRTLSWGLSAPALPSRGCDFVSHPLFLSYHHDGVSNIVKGLYTGYKKGGGSWKEEGERVQASLIPSTLLPTSPPSYVASETLNNPPPHIAGLPPKSTSPARTEYARASRKTLLGVFLPAEHGYDVAEDSRRHLHLDFNTDTTISSYPRFRTQTPAPEYAGLSVLAYFGSLNPFPASADSTNTVVWSFDGLSPPSPPPSVNTDNDEFIVAVVPEAIDGLLDGNFAAALGSYKVGVARMDTSTMEASCSYADTTIVLGDVDNPRITILGSLGAGVIIERLYTGYKKGGGSWKEGERLRYRVQAPPSPPTLLPDTTSSSEAARRPLLGFPGSLNTITTSAKPALRSFRRYGTYYVPHLLIRLPTHSPSPAGLPAASVNRCNDEFVVTVVPEAIEGSWAVGYPGESACAVSNGNADDSDV